MTDPFESLRTPMTPVDPDPTFAARLRSRVERALALPKGVTVSNLTLDRAPATTTATSALISPEPASAGLRHGDIGYVSLWVPDIHRAATFFADVLGWQYAPGSGPLGRQVAGLSLHHGMWGGEPRSTLFLCFAVDDVDAAVARVRAGGGSAGEPHVEPYGRIAECVDDQGVRFAVFDPPGRTAQAHGTRSHSTRRGDLAYVTMEVEDSARARAFYAAVLGWRFAPGRVEDGWQVADVTPLVGVSGGHLAATTVPMYKVDDIAAAVTRVRSAGGTATDPEVQPYGISSTCSDDQGTRFYLGDV
jgi:predicted enzyme related to lactoylglutathione lyase